MTMPQKISRRSLLMTGLAAALNPRLTRAQDKYPGRFVKVVMPYLTGGPNDVATRILSEQLSRQWGVPVVVFSKPGANGSIGAQEVKNSDSDGYTLLSGAMFIVLNPLIYPETNYTVKDFVPIAEFGAPPNIIVVPQDAPWRNLHELIDYGRAHPGALKSPHAGLGSSIHLGLSLFLREAGIQALVVPYKGSVAYLPDLLANRLDFAFLATQLALPQVKGGKLRILASVSHERLSQLPDVATTAELGYPGSVVLPWSGLFAAAGTPQPVIDILRESTAKALADSDVRARYAEMYAEIPKAPQDFPNLVAKEQIRWHELVQTRAIDFRT